MQYVIEQYGWEDNHYALLDSRVFSSFKKIKERSYNKNGYTFCITKLENEIQNTRRRGRK